MAYFIKNIRYFFWVFILLLLLLQLLNTKELEFLGAFLYSFGLMVLMVLHETFIRQILIRKYQLFEVNTTFVIYNLSITLLTSLLLTGYGYIILSEFLKPGYRADADNLITSMFFGLFLITTFISGMCYALETFKRNLAYEKKHRQLEKNVLKIEIEHLRNQLTPHFTFNILNNLQFLIRKDKNEALDLLSRYSKILKYYIYESQNKFIKLEDEITFLKYYFQLEKDKSDEELTIQFTINDIPENQQLIIPFLLSTFIENAFKHVAPNLKGNFIRLHINVEDDSELNLQLENTFNEITAEEKKPGIGLEQARKRLELSYPNNYELHQQSQNGIYKIKLKLNLSKVNEMYRS